IFDTYILILKIVLIVISSLIGVGFLIQTILNPISILDYFIDMIVSLVTALPTAFGWTTFGFALGELYDGFKQKDLLGKAWHPTDLPPIPDEKKQIKRSESIVAIIIYAVLIVFLAFSSDHFGVWVFQDEFTGVVPFLNAQIYSAYILLILIFGFGMLKECFKLVTRKWTYRLASLISIVNIFSIVAILLVISGPDFWNPYFMNELVEAGVVTMGSKAFDVVMTIWEQATFWFFI